jgi:hypothetical protein
VRINPMAVSLLLASASLLPGIGHAQAPDSAPFHHGQWGAEFHIANGFFGAGALHFSSPTHAILVDFSTAYSHSSVSGTASTNAIGAAVDLGTRAYHPFGERLYRSAFLSTTAGRRPALTSRRRHSVAVRSST